MFNPRELEYFLAVEETGSISAAARKLWVSQPAVSKAVSSLESSVGSRLFTRAASGMQLTVAGENLLPIAQDLMERNRRAENVAKSWAEHELTLRIACPATTAGNLIAPFTASGGPIEDVIATDPGKAYSALKDGADVAISTWEPPPSLSSRELWRRPITAQAPQRQGSGEAWMDIRELLDSTLLIPGHGSAVERMILNLSDELGPELPTTRMVYNGTHAQALAAAGRGVALVAERPLFSLESQMLMLDEVPILMHFYAAWDKYHYAAEIIPSVIDRFLAWEKATRPIGRQMYPGTP